MENLMPFNDFFRYFIFALYGAVAYVILDVLNRNVESPRTPKDFSWAFFWKDNKVRFVYLFILAPILILAYTDITGNKITLFNAFLIGFSIDAFVSMLMKLKNKW